MCVFPVIWCSQLTASKSRDDHVPACQKLVGWNPAVLTMVAPRPSGPVVGCFGIVSLFTVHSFRVQTRSTISPLIECESSLSQQTQARECGCVALIYHAFSNPSRYFRQRGQLTIFAFNKRTHLYNRASARADTQMTHRKESNTESGHNTKWLITANGPLQS